MPSSEDLKHLSRQHKKFVDNRVNGMTIQQSAELAGFTYDYGKELMGKPSIKTLLKKRLEEAGLNEEKIASKISDGLEAMAPPRKDGGTLYPDQFVRKQFLDLLLRIRGDYAPEVSEHVEKVIHVTIDRDMVKSLRDSGFIAEDEGEILEAEIVKEDDRPELPEHTEQDKES